MTGEAIKKAPGRPRNPAKRAALLVAARNLFLERGPDAVTLDHVIAQAGVSRATLYSNFNDKAELLATVIEVETERLVTDLRTKGNIDQPIAQSLTSFGKRLLRFLAEADTLAFERLIGQAAQVEPSYGARFFLAGPGRVKECLLDLIQAGQRRGELEDCDPEQAANDLHGLWQGFWRLKVQFGHSPAPGPRELDRLARHGVRQFLRLYASTRK